jgi:Leucine-rich repeat (LRR) protein
MTEVVEALERLGYGGSGTMNRGDVASTIDLSSADRKKLIKAKKQPLGSITEVVASEKTKYLFAKIIGGSFGTIVAPILVFYLNRHLEKEDKPAVPPAATAPAAPVATVPPVVVATNTTTQPPTPVTPVTTQPNQSWNTPVFQRWVKATQALPAEKQIEAVSQKLMELNPGFDGKLKGVDGTGTPRIENGVVTGVVFVTENVIDISPVRALTGLKLLKCGGEGAGKGKLSDLSPLSGIALTHLYCHNTQVSDLSPLEGMTLTTLGFSDTPVSDLLPLKGLSLTELRCDGTQVSDLSPLTTMNLTTIFFTPKNITTGLDVIRQMKRLKSIGIGNKASEKFAPAEFWKKYDAGEFGKHIEEPKLAYLDPAFQKWVADTQKLPAEQQIEAVSKKLIELNPGFDGTVMATGGTDSPKIENGVVTNFGFVTDDVTDISPIRAFVKLKALNCRGSGLRKGKLLDLSPLQGMPLTNLYCSDTQVSDLSPLRAMELGVLYCSNTQVLDLTPLRGMKLKSLSLGGTDVSDLSLLEDCGILNSLNISKTKVTPASVAALQKALPNCKIEWDDPAKAPTNKLAYLDPAFQQWVKATQALPAEKQIEAVSKKLMELNPGFDGKLAGANLSGKPVITGGTVRELEFRSDLVADLSPVRAFSGLRVLGCLGSDPGANQLADLAPLQGVHLP